VLEKYSHIAATLSKSIRSYGLKYLVNFESPKMWQNICLAYRELFFLQL